MMMRRDTQAIMQKLSVIVIVSSLAISAVICAPQQQQQQQQQQMQQNPSNSVSSSQQGQHQTSASAVSNSNHYNPQRQQVASSTSTTASEQSAASIAPAASVASGQPSTVSIPTYNSETNSNNNDASADAQPESASPSSSSSSSDAKSAIDNSEASELDIFDGKSPFTDDSLWQIPFQMVGDGLTSADEKSGDQMANSASETSSLNDNDGDDEEQAQSAPIPDQPSGNILATASGHSQPLEPAIESIVADDAAAAVSAAPAKSSDLKTAAGYHYPTQGGHGGHHYPASGHHGGADYHGGHGYFQYVDVPKPDAYDFGYRRGNSKHTIERYEKKHGPHFTTKVKWSDKHGHGVHTWDYNHDDHHKGYNHYDDDHHGGHHDGYHHQHQKKYTPKKHY